MRAMQVQAIRPDTSARAAMARPPVSRQPSRLPGARARAERDRSARPCRERSGSRAYALGVEAEQQACAALEREGWQVLGRRLRTGAGEVDMVAEREGLLAIIEVKARPTLAEAAAALSAGSARACPPRPRSCWPKILAGDGKGCGSTCCWWTRRAPCAASPTRSGRKHRPAGSIGRQEASAGR
jgi:Uncharacterised protein family UPF0102